MTKKHVIQIFEEKKVRTVWDDEHEKWYFSIVDVCNVLTESKDYQTARKYWNKLKQRLKEEGNETVTNCHQLKLKAEDGKMRLTDVADFEQLFLFHQLTDGRNFLKSLINDGCGCSVMAAHRSPGPECQLPI